MNDTISTGSLWLDLNLDIGGLQRGHIVEIFGPLNSGKSRLCYNILSQAQRQGGWVALIDADHSFNSFSARAANIALDRIIVALPGSAEDALGMAHTLVNSAVFSVVAIDSLDSLVPFAELSMPLGKYEYHDLAELLSRWLPRLARDILENNVLFLVTRLQTDKHYPVYHQLKVHLDRLALSFHAAQRLMLTGDEKSADNGRLRKITIKIVKNKFCPCFKSKSLDIIVNRNFNNIIEILEVGERVGLIRRIHGNYYYQEIRLGSGQKKVIEFLRDRPEIAEQIELSIRQRFIKA